MNLFSRLAGPGVLLGALLLGVLSIPPRTAHAFEHDVVVVLDNSGSMRRNDPDRIAPLAVRQLIERQDEETRVALLVFDDRPRIAVPLTAVRSGAGARFEQGLDTVDYRGRYTNIPSAIERAVYHLRTEGREGARRTILFLTDGRVDTGDEERDQELLEWLQAGLVEAANDAGVHIHGIAFTEDADYLVIESVTRSTGGTYVRAFDPSALRGAFERIDEASRRAAEGEPPGEEQARDEAAEEVAAPAPTAAPEPAPVAPTEQPQAVEDPLYRPARFALGGAIVGLTLLAFFLFLRRSRARSGSGSAARPTDMPAAFLVGGAGVERVRYDLGPVTVLGRKESQRDVVSIVIPSDTVSRRHATLRYRDGAFWLQDHQTRNGTFVNDRKIQSETRLEPGDRLRVDRFEFVLDVESWDGDEATRFHGEDDEATRFSFSAALDNDR